MTDVNRLRRGFLAGRRCGDKTLQIKRLIVKLNEEASVRIRTPECDEIPHLNCIWDTLIKLADTGNRNRARVLVGLPVLGSTLLFAWNTLRSEMWDIRRAACREEQGTRCEGLLLSLLRVFDRFVVQGRKGTTRPSRIVRRVRTFAASLLSGLP